MSKATVHATRTESKPEYLDDCGSSPFHLDDDVILASAVLIPPDADGLLFDDLADEPAVPRLSFVDWIAAQAAWYRSLEGTAAAWLAGRLDQLAADARKFGANTPAGFERAEQEAGYESDMATHEAGFRAGVRHVSYEGTA